MKVHPPTNEFELMQRANNLKGKSLQYLANELEIELPMNLKKNKGLIGEMLESYLGASASSLSEPDFMEIGVELKSIPLNQHGRPKESTFVCNTPLQFKHFPRWSDSSVKKKLDKVLWIPVEADPRQAIGMRRIGNPILWSPGEKVEARLKSDWEELIELIYLGNVQEISSSIGEYLQIRPKGANAKSLTTTINQTGESTETLPRGFYLRASFTNQIINYWL